MSAATIEQEFSEETPTALYRVYSADGRLLYVGVTGSLRVRMARHADEKPWWGEVARRTVQWMPSRTEALKAETAAIQAEQPLYNIASAVRQGAATSTAEARRATRRALVDELAERQLVRKHAHQHRARTHAITFDGHIAEIKDMAPGDGFALLSILQAEIEVWRHLAAELRGELARTIRDEHDLSLSELATVLGLSRQRAFQLVAVSANPG